MRGWRCKGVANELWAIPLGRHQAVCWQPQCGELEPSQQPAETPPGQAESCLGHLEASSDPAAACFAQAEAGFAHAEACFGSAEAYFECAKACFDCAEETHTEWCFGHAEVRLKHAEPCFDHDAPQLGQKDVEKGQGQQGWRPCC